jgi:hypothetical protein
MQTYIFHKSTKRLSPDGLQKVIKVHMKGYKYEEKCRSGAIPVKN